jgi:hypothetical protein
MPSIEQKYQLKWLTLSIMIRLYLNVYDLLWWPLRMFMKVYGQLIFAFGVTQTILTAAADAH